MKIKVYNDVDYLRSVEKNAFSLVLSEEIKNYQFDEDKLVENLKKVVDITSEYGTGLLITDQFLDDAGIVQVGIDDLDTVNGEFDYVIVNLNKSLITKRDDLTSKIILDIFSDIRVGGLVFVPENTYNFISSGRKGVEALLKSLNLKIKVPPYDFDAGIIASKNNF